MLHLREPSVKVCTVWECFM